MVLYHGNGKWETPAILHFTDYIPVMAVLHGIALGDDREHEETSTDGGNLEERHVHIMQSIHRTCTYKFFRFDQS